jgi:hypothetical protein
MEDVIKKQFAPKRPKRIQLEASIGKPQYSAHSKYDRSKQALFQH